MGRVHHKSAQGSGPVYRAVEQQGKSVRVSQLGWQAQPSKARECKGDVQKRGK